MTSTKTISALGALGALVAGAAALFALPSLAQDSRLDCSDATGRYSASFVGDDEVLVTGLGLDRAGRGQVASRQVVRSQSKVCQARDGMVYEQSSTEELILVTLRDGRQAEAVAPEGMILLCVSKVDTWPTEGGEPDCARIRTRTSQAL